MAFWAVKIELKCIQHSLSLFKQITITFVTNHYLKVNSNPVIFVYIERKWLIVRNLATILPL